jgi:hypothetical protein
MPSTQADGLLPTQARGPHVSTRAQAGAGMKAGRGGLAAPRPKAAHKNAKRDRKDGTGINLSKFELAPNPGNATSHGVQSSSQSTLSKSRSLEARMLNPSIFIVAT